MRDRSALLVLFLAAGCVADPDEVPLRGSIAMMRPGLEAELSAAPVAQSLAAAMPTIVYMNRQGGTFTPGGEDSRMNRSAIIDATGVVAPWTADDDVWADVMTCVRAQLAPFAIDVTDVDPGNVPHVESVVGGAPSDLGFREGVAGISPFTTDCRRILSPIVYVFAEVLPEKPQVVCRVASQEIGHSFGLDHEFLCEDPMSYLGGCGPKTFQDVYAPCGEGEGRPCRIEGLYDCGADTQNSYARIAERVGLRGGAPVPPSLSIVRPADGDVVAPGFAIVADASSVQGAVGVELRIDGVAIESAWSAPYELVAPTDLEPGTHIVELIANDGLAQTVASVAVRLDTSSAEDGPRGEGRDPRDRDVASGFQSCSAAGGTAAPLSGLLLVLALLHLRRRAECRA